MDERRAIVARRSRASVEALAARDRQTLELGPFDRVDMAVLMDSVLPDMIKNFSLEVEFDHLMEGREAFTDLRVPTITFSNKTWDNLERNEWRSRMTAAHELGHLLMHTGRWVGFVEDGLYDPLSDPERQADIYAAAFMMPEVAFRRSQSVAEAAHFFGVSKGAVGCRARNLGMGRAIGLYDQPAAAAHKKKGRKLMARTP